MENIYQTCQRCKQGKITHYSTKNKWINIALVTFFVIMGYFFFTTAASIIADKLVDKEIPLTDSRLKQLLITAILTAVVVIPAHYFYNILKHLRSWLTKECPYCEQGYIIAQRASNIQAIIYFFDLFLFQQILLPMFKTLTFQFLRKTHKKVYPIIAFLKFIFYLSLFFGAIPFLVFLLGRDHLLGLVVAIFVMVYILGLIFFGSEENRVYQKGTIFLSIPLYYVCMVEIFRWSWFLSSKDLSIIPDQSSFLWMGIENLIRTQLFMDLFEVYDLGIATMSATTFLTHSAIFATRLVIDIALIAMLIQMAIDSFQRARHYKFTGEKVENITEGEVLTDLENLVLTGSPKNIHDVKENLETVLGVVQQVKPYVKSVQQVAFNEEDKKAAEECSLQIDQLQPGEKEEKQPYSIHFLQRILAIVFVCAWASSFSLGINTFIRNVTAHEISLLMAAAERDQFKLDPIARQNFYLKAISKDLTYHPAIWKSAQTYLKMADANLNLLDTDEALNNIEGYFEQVSLLRETKEYENLYQSKVTDLQPEAYMLRGLAFLLQERTDLAIAELRRRQTLVNRRLIFNIMLMQTSQGLFTKSAGDLLESAYSELGFDAENPSLVYGQLLDSIINGKNNRWYKVIYDLERVLEQNKIKNSNLKQKFCLYLAQAAMRQGKKSYDVAEKYFREVLKMQPNNLEVVLGLANLYRLQKKYQQMYDILLTAPQETRKVSYNAYLLSTYVLLGKKDKALELLGYIDTYPVRKHLKGYVKKYLYDSFPEESLLDAAFSWDVALVKKQRTVAYFYLALQNIRKKSYGKAADYLRQVILLGQRDLVEYHQSKIEFENIQILLENKNYQPYLFFEKAYFEKLNDLVKTELQNIISPEKKAIEGLKLIMESSYQENKRRGIRALTIRPIVSAKNFLPFLVTALQENDDELKKVALEGLVGIGSLSLPAKEYVEKELAHSLEDIRLLCVKVFAQWGKEGIESLVKALENDSEYVQRDAAYALAQLGETAKSAVKELQKLLSNEKSMVRFASFTALRQIGSPHNKEALFGISLKHNDRDLRLAAMSEVEKHYSGFFDEYKKDIVPFLIETLLHDKDGQNRKWAALRLLIYQDKKILNDKKIFSELEQKTKLSLSSSNLDEKLRMAIWLLNTYDLWKQKKELALSAITERWKLGDTEDQRRVTKRILSQVVNKNVLLLRAAFEDKDKHVKDAAQFMVEQMVEAQNFSQTVSAVIAFCAEIMKDKNNHVRALSMIKFALQKKLKISMPVCLKFIHHEQKQVQELFVKAIVSVKNDYQWTISDIKNIFTGLNKKYSVVSSCKVAHHFRLQHPRLFSTYARLLESEQKEVLLYCIDLVALYSNKQEVNKLFSKLASTVENKADVADYLFRKWSAISTFKECYDMSQQYPFAAGKFPSIVLELQRKRNLQENEITEFLFAWMKGANKDAVVSATAILPRLKVWPAEAMTILLDLVQTSDEAVSSEAQRVLLEMTSIYAIEDLRTWLKDVSPRIRSAAVKAVGKMGVRAAELFPIVLSLIDDESTQVQETVVSVFSSIGNPVIPFLEQALSSSDRKKINAIACLHQMGEQDSEVAIKTLIKYMNLKEDNFTLLSLRALEKHTSIRFQPIVLPALQKLSLRSEESQIIYWYLMYVIGEKQQALKELTNLLEVSQKNSLKILDRLIKVSPKYVVTYLKKAMQQRYSRIDAIQAMETLAKIENVAGVTIILNEMKKDANPDVQRKAQEVLDLLSK
ncbi:HEAT repeat domain-containing protein [Candidatus Uabimicrobium sp. HlEnr_7]|uniref:HEAT repeat domain-containing protein n=1 Tax=Candidatus Uabimicrobium helgolandensis TaxID=3095367 RepID=UPI003555C510